MRIVLLLNGRFPTEKAYGIQTTTMAEGYAALGHEVAIAYPRRTTEEPHPIPGVTFLPFGKKRKLFVRGMFPFFRFFGAIGAARSLRDFRPDFVIANDPLQALLVSKSFSVIWELHDLPSLKRFSRRVLLKLILRNVIGIVSTNRLKLDVLQEVTQKLPPSIVAPNATTFDQGTYRRIGHDEARQSFQPPLEKDAIVYAGQLFDWKGVDTLIASAGHLPSSRVIHIVGGTGRDLERCQGLARRLPTGSARVEFHGLRPKEEIPRWLRAAALVIIPNSGKFDVSIRDTSPLKLFEAFAAGAAIVASDLPSIREVADESEAVAFVPPDDPKSLAKTIAELMENPSKIDKMRRAAELFPLMDGKARAKRIVEFIGGLRHTASA